MPQGSREVILSFLLARKYFCPKPGCDDTKAIVDEEARRSIEEDTQGMLSENKYILTMVGSSVIPSELEQSQGSRK
jgi:hypothetical protein